MCMTHGGGRKCKEPGCTNLVAGGGKKGMCISHGGGRKCREQGCDNLGKRGGKKGMCQRHGGGSKCKEPGCDHFVVYRGKKGVCIAHGGGVRCPICLPCIDSRVGSKKYDGHCATCFKRKFPDDPRSKVIYEHTKEIMVRNAINKHFDGFVHDTPLWSNNCDCAHRRRIDHRKLIQGTLLGVETDENAHRGYDEHDEEIRYDDFVAYHTGKFIFIRFNIDGKDSLGNAIDIKDLLRVLIDEIHKQIGRIERFENDGEELVEIVKLFYPEPKVRAKKKKRERRAPKPASPEDERSLPADELVLADARLSVENAPAALCEFVETTKSAIPKRSLVDFGFCASGAACETHRRAPCKRRREEIPTKKIASYRETPSPDLGNGLLMM